MSAIRRAVASALESGRFDGRLAESGAHVWRLLANPVRPVALPAGARVIGVGGATLGGSGKTPVVIELARRYAAEGVSVVASSYRTRLDRARVVSAGDDAHEVGDEAALLARELNDAGATVVSGPDRAQAIALAARHATTVIVDALLQTRPQRLSTSLLVLDASSPWGSGACPPRGDLRAAPRKLLAACDTVVLVERARARSAPLRSGRPTIFATSEIDGAVSAGGPLGLDELSRLRVGVVLAVARPERILADLAAHGIVPCAVELFADHAVPGPPKRTEGIDAWLTTRKCATKMGVRYGGAPLFALLHRVRLP